jgi:hypothetical protein
MPCRISAPVWGFIDIATAEFVFWQLSALLMRENTIKPPAVKQLNIHAGIRTAGAIHGA